jgi:hypothetical protein
MGSSLDRATIAWMIRWLLLSLLLTGCTPGGHELLEGSPARPRSLAASVVLHGIEGVGPPPPGCRVLGRVRAWSRGEKTFPCHDLRVAAARLGGDAVIEIRPDPAALDRRRPTYQGTVVRCR